MTKYFTILESHAKVCYRNINNDENIDLSIFTPGEFNQFKSFKNVKRQKIFYHIRLMAREEGLGEIIYNKDGKPLCANYQISITHSGDWIGLMISKKAIGLDIECNTTKILKIKDRFLDQEEQNLICFNDLYKMCVCWSAKEAVFKMIGGDTTFFKLNQKIVQLNSEQVSVIYKNGSHSKQINMKIKTLDNNYHLVYTM